MKALSLLQPWASLIMLGYKNYETRSWATKHRGTLAIHASAGKPAWAREVAATCPEISAILAKHRLTFDTLPRGAVLGICSVERMHPTENMLPLSIRELACGDYSPGRWAWELDWIRPASCEIPCKGALSLWELPGEVEAQLGCPRCHESLNPDAVHPCLCCSNCGYGPSRCYCS